MTITCLLEYGGPMPEDSGIYTRATKYAFNCSDCCCSSSIIIIITVFIIMTIIIITITGLLEYKAREFLHGPHKKKKKEKKGFNWSRWEVI